MFTKIVQFFTKCRHMRVHGHKPYFWDVVGNKQVFIATCGCGNEYMVESTFQFPIFKVEL